MRIPMIEWSSRIRLCLVLGLRRHCPLLPAIMISLTTTRLSLRRLLLRIRGFWCAFSWVESTEDCETPSYLGFSLSVYCLKWLSKSLSYPYFFSIKNVNCLLMSIATTIPTHQVGGPVMKNFSFNNGFLRESAIRKVYLSRRKSIPCEKVTRLNIWLSISK